jgi:predicted transcriptional regulator
MKRTTVFLEEAIERDVRAIAERRGVPASLVVREALERYVSAERRKSRPLGFVAAGRSGRRDVAERHEDLLFGDLRPHGAVAPKRRR